MQSHYEKYIRIFLPALILSAGMVLITNIILNLSSGINVQNDRYKDTKFQNIKTEPQHQVTSTINNQTIPSISFSVPFNPQLFSMAVNKFPPFTKPKQDYSSLSLTDKESQRASSSIKGAIVPHHDLASGLIAELFQKLSNSYSPKKIIIIGPNHPDRGPYSAATGNIVWQIPQGSVLTNEKIVEKLIYGSTNGRDTVNYVSTAWGIANTIVAEEHSIFTLIPFINYYFPNAQVVPIILSSTHDLKKSEQLAQNLAALVDQDTLVLASIDFSHYLSSRITLQKDAFTKEAIINRDYVTMARLNNDYLDSPPSLITFLKLMDALDVHTMNIVSNTNSGTILERELKSSTSYFTMVFEK